MKQWDNLVEQYIEEYVARGINVSTISNVRSELEKLGVWLKRKRPKPAIEGITSEHLIGYIKSRSVFKSKSTIYGLVSRLRGMGDFLVREEIWPRNPLRWIKGPKVTPYHRMPKRLSTEEIKKLWAAAAQSNTPFQQHQWMTALSLLYGTGIRRGELARLTLQDWCVTDSILTVDGRKTGMQRSMPAPPLVEYCINKYLPYRHNFLSAREQTSTATLFVNQQGLPVTEVV